MKRIKGHILIVEDDRLLSRGLCYELLAEGYTVDTAFSAKQALARAAEARYDLILIDVGLPDGDGFSLSRRIRDGREPSLIFLTAQDLEADQAKSFCLGADGYITKPISMMLLRMRVAAALSRAGDVRLERYDDGFLTLNFTRPEAARAGAPLALTATEYKLLRLFVTNAGQVLTRATLLDKIWDIDGNIVDDHALTVNINRLRSKLEDETRKYIKTVYGMGYLWIGENMT